jgi:hypothetical protein
MPDKADDPAHASAAGPWQEGEPAKRGRYLIEYEEYDQRRVFVADYRPRRIGDDMELQWAGIMDTATVLRYAPIHSPYVQYPE